MKLFWAIISVFAVAAILVVASQSRSDRPASGPAGDWQAATEPVQPMQPVIAPPDSGESEEVPQRSTEVVDDQPGPDDEPELVEPLFGWGPDGPPSRPAGGDAADELAADLFASSQQPRINDQPMSGGSSFDEDHEHLQQMPSNPPNPWMAEESDLGGSMKPLEHSVQRQDDGSLLLDETFVIQGEGTRESPYEITWDLLLSAAETYQPRLGMEDIPERLKMIDGKRVRISGHLMFPMASGQADELLVMLNMWDGCCLGTMPSAYDAVEVQLSTPAPAGNRHFFTYGSLEGTLTIDPYLINDWLIGLYVMEDASLTLGM